MTSLVLTALFVTAVLLTYYPSASVLSILAVWTFLRVRDFRFDRRFLWIAVAGLIALVPLLAALLLAPIHTSRQLPTVAFLTRLTT